LIVRIFVLLPRVSLAVLLLLAVVFGCGLQGPEEDGIPWRGIIAG
jgi:hypothetical protein